MKKNSIKIQSIVRRFLQIKKLKKIISKKKNGKWITQFK